MVLALSASVCCGADFPRPFQPEMQSKAAVLIGKLIENAADAIDKYYALSLFGRTEYGNEQLAIQVLYDETEKIITIYDNGLGMEKDDLINLGRSNLSRSRTSTTTDVLRGSSPVQVKMDSFYEIADKITLVTKHPQDMQYVWQTVVPGLTTITEDSQGPSLGRGTKITLHMNIEAGDFVDGRTLEALLKTYSGLIRWPIKLRPSAQKWKWISRE